jgi:hypothetical protein
MKKIKLILIIAVLGIFSVSMTSCKKCKGEDPSARIINNGIEKASVQIKTSGGNTVNINNVDPGTASPYSSYASGEVVFTITVSTINYVDTVLMSQCYDYDISIDANNKITTIANDRND